MPRSLQTDRRKGAGALPATEKCVPPAQLPVAIKSPGVATNAFRKMQQSKFEVVVHSRLADQAAAGLLVAHILRMESRGSMDLS